MRGEQLVKRAAPRAPAPQLPAHHALGAALLVERRAVGIARLGKNAHAEAEDFSRLARLIMLDDGEADRGRADVQAENKHCCPRNALISRVGMLSKKL